jgi:transposase
MVGSMTGLSDLTTATRAELLALIATQQQTIAQQQVIIATLEQRVADLERRLGSSGGKGVPGTKPTAQTRSRTSGTPRKQRARGYSRRRSSAPTQVVTHAADQCPTCGIPLTGGWVKRRREVIELPLAPVQVIEHRVLARVCPHCRQRVVPQVALAGAVAGRQRLGTGLVSLIATLREAGRWPVAMIQWYLRTVHRLHLSVGAIVGASHRVATAGQPAVAQIQQQIRASPAVQADETGWRENGVNGYVWSFSTPTAAYITHGSREGVMVDTVLGEGFTGVLGSDFYAGYHHYPGEHQRCWVHLLRDIHDLRLLYPTDRAVTRWAQAIRKVYDRAKAFASDDPRERVRMRRRCEQALAQVCRKPAADPTAAHGRLSRRILRHLSELFVFVSRPEVPADNNGAERSVRHLVTSRKISGGTRSPAGTRTKMTLATLFGTWRLQGRDPLLACFQILASPLL